MTDRNLIQWWVGQQDLKKELLRQNNLVNNTLDWIVQQLDKKLLELDKAIQDNNHAKVEACRREYLDLVAKSNREEKNIDICLALRQKAIEDEKKALLSYSGKKD